MRHRTLIATAILILGVGGAGWLMFHNETNAGDVVISVSSSTQGGAQQFTDTSADVGDAANFTDNAIREYGKEILRLNAQGQGTGQPVALPSDEVLANIVQQQTSKLIPVSLFSESDVAVSDQISTTAQRAYVAAVRSATKNAFANAHTSIYAAISLFITKGDASALTAQRDAMVVFVRDARAIPVPRPALSLHLTMLNVWQKRLAYTEVLLASSGDQLKSIAAMKQLSDLNADEQKFVVAFQTYAKKLQ